MWTILRKLWKSIRTENYNLLLVLLVFLFVFKPYNISSTYYGIWKVLLTATLLSAVYNCDHKKKVKSAVFWMSFPSLVLTWLDLFFTNELIVISFAFFTIFFFLVCSISILFDVLRRPKVTFETLRGVVCVYFLVGFLFSYIYFLIEYISPGSFLINQQIVPVFPHPYYLAEMLYASFITLLTIGYGDIIPVKDASQTACILEGMIGQFYIAILVSRLIAVSKLGSLEEKKS